MTTARREQVDLSVTPYYHCISRCVRQAYLCGEHGPSGRDYSHRKEWVKQRIKYLARLFAVDVCAYAVMSNHLHLVLRADQERARRWSDDEVIERHIALHPLSAKHIEGRLPKSEREKLVATWRERLYDISWFMRSTSEYIARRANKEDRVKGRFWEGRFKSQALADERGILTCMVYVDLNPLRAGMSETLEGSDFTSIQERLQVAAKNKSQRKGPRAPKGLAAFFGEKNSDGRGQGVLPVSYHDYVQLLRWTMRQTAGHADKDVNVSNLPEALRANGTDGQAWMRAQSGQELLAASVLGSLEAVQACAKRRGKKSLRGIRLARDLAA